MALSRIAKNGDGVTTQFAVNFALDYIYQNDVTCRVGSEVDGGGNPVYRTITFLALNLLQISGTPAPVGVGNVLFERTVSKTALDVSFADGDVLDDVNLDIAQKQTMMAVHEVLDGRFSRPVFQVPDGDPITNLTLPIAADRASKLFWFDASGAPTVITMATLAASVPSVTAFSTDFSLPAGVLTWSTPLSADFTKVAGVLNWTPVLSSDFSHSGGVLTFVKPTREVLVTSRTYFIRTDGNDSNTGLTDSPSGAFLTWQHACDFIAKLDFNGQQVTLQHGVETGVKTFTVGNTINALTGAGTLQVKGSPIVGNTVFNVPGADVWKVFQVGATSVNFDQMTLIGGTLGEIAVYYTSVATVGSAVYFGPATFAQVYVHDRQAMALLLGSSYKIIGGGGYHIFINGGFVFHESCVVTLTGTPVFTGAFVQGTNGGAMQLTNAFFAGGSTGPRFFLQGNSVINSFGQGINALPGSSAGVSVTGGQYLP